MPAGGSLLSCSPVPPSTQFPTSTTRTSNSEVESHLTTESDATNPAAGSSNAPCAGAAPLDAARYEQLVELLGPSVTARLGLYPLPEGFKLSVIMPVYNEKATIHEILRRVRATPIPKEIIVVDDCSADGTRDLLREEEARADGDLRVLLHDKNQGKGAALRTGIEQATGDVLIVQDADLEYDPNDYLHLIQPIVDGRADVVYGSRFRGDVERVHLFWHRVANGMLTLLSNMFNNVNLTDMETCYKAFRRGVLDDITIKENRFGVEPELTAKIARRRHRIYEVPITYSGRDYSEGKKIGLRDAFRALWCVVRYGIAD